MNTGGTPIGRAECVQDPTFGELVWNITMYLNDCGPLRGTNEVVEEIIEVSISLVISKTFDFIRFALMSYYFHKYLIHYKFTVFYHIRFTS